ncbi:MAG TPA: 4Fe-4S dicluster domain-containing protein [Clostridia bacterium]|nr:MAG: NAD(P)H-quinone oxidoreductase subunit I [Firmicutes bacterium ADurb.Bin248]HOG00302.1 4Fe-4S dicluster domain-containing protein [Clostridia bacterium]HOS17680.1 4Fe-4S dicluster domain-containing protein [Clostridia bacterium]HPK15979.1 4Fe-4S dicluster domain-containing protein [Clostridia bacterium]
MKKKLHLPGELAGQAIRNVFAKPATIDYPHGDPSIPANYRGRLVYDAPRCINCLMCMRDCPSKAIRIENRGTKENPDMHAYLNVARCIFCCQCVDSCPKKCLSASNDILLARLSRDELSVEL